MDLVSSGAVAIVNEFLVAACAPRENRPSGTLGGADAIVAACPDVANAEIYTAAALGDADVVCRFLADDPALASMTGGPYEWDALTYLCFSRYLRLRGSDGFVRAAVSLLDAGADPNTGFFELDHHPEPTFESALYGAAGVAHHAGLTRLLLERGADPNRGDEVAYHAAFAGCSSTAPIPTLLSGHAPAARPKDTEPLQEPLSESELRVLRYLPTNLRGPEIAADLFVSLNTIRTHMRNVYAKLGVHTRADAVKRARELGLLSPSSLRR